MLHDGVRHPIIPESIYAGKHSVDVLGNACADHLVQNVAYAYPDVSEPFTRHTPNDVEGIGPDGYVVPGRIDFVHVDDTA